MSRDALLSLLYWIAIGLAFFWLMRRGGCGGMAHGHGGHARTPGADGDSRFHSPSGKPVDPVCRMEIDPARAVGTRLVEGNTFFFCSPTCLEAFDKNPTAYTRAQADEERHGHQSAC